MKKKTFLILLAFILSVTGVQSQLKSFRIYPSYLKIGGIPISTLGLNFGPLVNFKKNKKISFSADLGFYLKRDYEYSTQPYPINELNPPPPITVNASVELNYLNFFTTFYYYIVGENDGKFNVYARLNLALIRSNFKIKYDDFDHQLYEYTGALDHSENGANMVDLYIGAGLGVEKRIRLIGIFLEFDLMKGMLQYNNHPNDFVQPLGNLNALRLNFGIRKLI